MNAPPPAQATADRSATVRPTVEPRVEPDQGIRPDSAIRAVGLVKTYAGKNGDVEAVRGVDLDVAPGRGVRVPRPERRRQVDHRPDAHHADDHHRRHAHTWPASTWPADPDGARRRIGVALQEAGLDPRQTGRELLVLQARLFGMIADRGRRRGRPSCSSSSSSATPPTGGSRATRAA